MKPRQLIGGTMSLPVHWMRFVVSNHGKHRQSVRVVAHHFAHQAHVVGRLGFAYVPNVVRRNVARPNPVLSLLIVYIFKD